MKKLAFLLLLIPFAFSAFAQADAIEYNDMIVGEQTKIYTKIADFSNAESNEDMELALKILQQQIEASIAAVKKLGAWHEDAALQASTLRLFDFYKTITITEYREMLDIMKHEQLTQEDVSRLEVLQDAVVEKEKKHDDDFAYNQDAFAKRWGFELAPIVEEPADY